MKLGIMQPYLFPYLGYFQLIGAVDKFVVYDDVNFIKQGWINRNYLFSGGRKVVFSVPLREPSSFRKIKDTAVNMEQYPRWADKFFKTLEMGYAKAPFYKKVCPLVEGVLKAGYQDISGLALASIKAVCAYSGIDTEILDSSSVYGNDRLKGEERVIDICKREGAGEYLNLPGGVDIYSRQSFAAEGISLRFISQAGVSYSRGGGEFVPGLSVVDLLMFNDKPAISRILGSYELE